MSDANEAMLGTDDPGYPGSPTVLHRDDKSSEHFAYVLQIQGIGWPAWLPGADTDLPSQEILYVAKESL